MSDQHFIGSGVYRIKQALLGIIDDDERTALTVPSNAEVTVLSTHDNAPIVDVRWEGKEFIMFEVDLSRHAERIEDSRDSAAKPRRLFLLPPAITQLSLAFARTEQAR